MIHLPQAMTMPSQLTRDHLSLKCNELIDVAHNEFKICYSRIVGKFALGTSLSLMAVIFCFPAVIVVFFVCMYYKRPNPLSPLYQLHVAIDKHRIVNWKGASFYENLSAKHISVKFASYECGAGGNCLFRSMAVWLYGDANKWELVRKDHFECSMALLGCEGVNPDTLRSVHDLLIRYQAGKFHKEESDIAGKVYEKKMLQKKIDETSAKMSSRNQRKDELDGLLSKLVQEMVSLHAEIECMVEKRIREFSGMQKFAQENRPQIKFLATQDVQSAFFGNASSIFCEAYRLLNAGEWGCDKNAAILCWKHRYLALFITDEFSYNHLCFNGGELILRLEDFEENSPYNRPEEMQDGSGSFHVDFPGKMVENFMGLKEFLLREHGVDVNIKTLDEYSSKYGCEIKKGRPAYGEAGGFVFKGARAREDAYNLYNETRIETENLLFQCLSKTIGVHNVKGRHFRAIVCPSK
jgi:hypothetical protein